MKKSAPERWTAVFRRLVGLYPAEFRRLFAHDMCCLFASQYRSSERKGSRASQASFLLRTFLGVLAGIIIEHLHRLIAQPAGRVSGPAPHRSRPRNAYNLGEGMFNLLQDLRFGARTLAKAPSLVLLAVLTLAFGIAVNSTLFSLVNTLVYSELPVEDPSGFVFVWATNERSNETRSALSLPDYAQIRDETTTLEGVAFFMRDSFVLTGEQEPIRVVAARTSDNFVEVWGVGIARGRGFRAGEEHPEAEPVALLSHGFWERRFGEDPSVIGRALVLDGKAHTVVGVLSEAMEYGEISEIDLWVPLAMNPAMQSRGERKGLVTARLAEGMDVGAASAELGTVGGRIEEAHPATHQGWSLRATSFADELLNDQDSAILSVLALSVAFVLFIACANVATMIMTRSSARSKEVAVRVALGADRLRLIRQFLTEGFLIASLAAIVGLIFTRWLLAGLVLVTGESHWLYRSAEIDTRVLLFTLGISLITPIIFSLVPSFKASAPALGPSLKDGGRGSSGGSNLRSQRLLVVSQVGMALVLMITTGLFVRTVIEIRTTDLGFDPEPLLTAVVDLPSSDYPSDSAKSDFFDRLVAELEASPEIEVAAFVNRHPLEDPGSRQPFTIQTHEASLETDTPVAYTVSASTGYFEAMGIPVLSGRPFRESDDVFGAPVALVSQALAEKHWPDSTPIGEHIRLNTEASGGEWVQIVGVVGRVYDVTNENNVPTYAMQIYRPFAQATRARGVMIARARTNPTLLAPAIRTRVGKLDAALAPVVRPMKDLKRDLMAGSNAIIALFSIFAAFALVMASMGIYGIVSFWVSQRRHEIGIRMALGASRSDVLRMVSTQGVRLIVLGAVFGFAGALLIGRLLANVVIGISTSDPLTFAITGAGLGIVALIANYVPAWNATRIDPVQTLRSE